ncbi:hypothetical protein G1C96_1412 [Bifidobacterium sp. DSM 109958]|uniref:Uncharacterized protein n=1 Tax=Bifidobacterium moraviense TaxID=2675323 RepID=A0A7Y0HZX3_9BIFI|nr:DUF6020 family protein [Bifidobacterium sp. DSM 109958]NMN00833.1 hypothetical protein [Bifidobacterium sp. DSM 109958]
MDEQPEPSRDAAAAQSGAHPHAARPRASVLACALLAAAPSCFALTASYADETAFTDLDHLIGGVWPYLSAYGPVAGMLLFLAVAALEYCGFAVIARNRAASSAQSPTAARERVWSVVLGLILAITLTVPPHSTTHLVSQLDAVGTPPAVASEYWTVWYWLYYAVRYVGFAALLAALSALALHGAVRAITRHERPAEEPHADASHADASHGIAEDTASDAHTASVESRPRPRIAAQLRYVAARLTRTLARAVTTFSPTHTFTLGAVILVCWTPWIVLLWPANIAADTVAQLVWMRTGQAWDPSTHEMLPGYALSNQHPWLDSLIYGAFDRFGLWIGSEAWGLWLLAFLQTALCALALGLAINYLGGVLRLPTRFCTAALAFMALTPIYGRLMMSVVKDSTVMPFFIVLMVLVMEYVRRVRAGRRLGPWLLIGIVTLAVLCGEMRKISVEIIAVTFVVFAVALARRRFTSLALAVTPLVVGMIIGSLAAPALHVAPAGKQEMIAIPLQQTSAYMVAHGDALSAADRETIGRVITCPADELDAYLTWNPWDGREIGSADLIKDRCFNRDATTRDLGAFLLVWAKLALRDPVTALSATPWLRDPFVMGPVYDEGWYVRWGWEEMGSNMIMPEYASTWTDASVSAPQRIGRAAYTFLENAPGVSLLMRENLYTVWVPLFAAALCSVLRRTRNWAYMTPWVITICSLMLLPGHQTRYTWTLAFGAALIAAIPLIRDGRETDARAAAD